MTPPDQAQPEGVRLQKVLAAAGVGSRRACEELVAAGRVAVDGEVVTTMGRRIDPELAVIHVDGLRVAAPDSGLVHLAVNKPVGVVSTMSDPQGRPDLTGLLRGRQGRLFHVGRLDADTEGLILLSNDGELAHRLTHPSFEIPKTYLAEVAGPVPRALGRQLREGVELDDGIVRVDDFKIIGRAGTRVMIEVVLHEGRKHVVRRLLAEKGHPVERLVRTRIGAVALGELRPGRSRPLTSAEVGQLYAAVGL